MGEVPTAGDKLKALWWGLFPPPKTLRRIYGLRSGNKVEFLYYVVRPLDLLLRRGRELSGLIIGSRRSKHALEKERRRRMIRAWAGGRNRKV